jgi:hypothetical protein
MANLRWKEGQVVSLRLKDGAFVLAQWLKSPYMVFFHSFSTSDDWPADAAKKADPLFFCAVTNQFLKFSDLGPHEDVAPRVFTKTPKHWISGFPGSRKITVWPGTVRERQFVILGSKPGGCLIEKDINATGMVDWPVIIPSIPLGDDRTIDCHELTSIWTYPILNERLHICHQLDRCVDPVKDLKFDRPPREEYQTAIDILASHGKPEDWGYSSKKSTGSVSPTKKTTTRIKKKSGKS